MTEQIAIKPTSTESPEQFFCAVAATMVATMEDVLGLEDTAAFLANVGERLGEEISQQHQEISGKLPSEPAALGRFLCRMNGRVGGDFKVASCSDTQMKLTAQRCPFGTRADGRPALCMTTINIFGRIAANARGYAAVRIDRSLALGHGGCALTLALTPPEDDDYHEFFG